PHPDLHSFPTRRSSDLKEAERSGELDVALASVLEGVRVITVLLAPYLPETAAKLAEALHLDDLSYEAAGYGARRLARVEKMAPLDRKSTRLNSSHDQIS